MPFPNIFGSKTFSPKKPLPRKAASLSNLATLDSTQRAQEFGIDYGTASLKLSGTQIKFEDGTWLTGKYKCLIKKILRIKSNSMSSKSKHGQPEEKQDRKVDKNIFNRLSLLLLFTNYRVGISTTPRNDQTEKR